MAPRRLRRADMHPEAVPLAELAGTGARAKGESHRLCIFANANMVATPQQACAYHHDSSLPRQGCHDAAHGRGVTKQQVALRWITQQGVGACLHSTNPMHLREALAACAGGGAFDLTDEELRQLGQLALQPLVL